MRTSGLYLALTALAAIACGDEPRDPDPAPPPVLSRVVAEPAGDHCATGGMAIHTGVDDDRDGALDDAEIDDTSYVCDGEVWQGDFLADHWRDPAAVAALGRARAVTGTLVLDGAPAIHLPRLEVVGDLLQIDTAVREVVLPRLWLVGRVSVVRGGALSRLEVPSLEQSGNWFLPESVRLPSLRAPALRSIGQFICWECGIGELSMPAVTAAGRLHLVGDIAAIDLRALTHLAGGLVLGSLTLRDVDGLSSLQYLSGGLSLVRNPALTRLAFPALQEVSGDLSIGPGQQASLAPALVEISFPAVQVVTGSIAVTNLPALTTLSLGDIEGSTRLELADLPALRSLALTGDVGDGGVAIARTGLEALDLPELQVAGPLELDGNPALREVRLPGLGPHPTKVVVQNHATLVDLALPAVSAAGSVLLKANPALATLDLSRLARVQDGIAITGAALADLTGLRGLQAASALRLEQMTALSSLTGLGSLLSLRSLWILDCDALVHLDGVGAGADVVTTLGISGNASLVDLAGLADLDLLAGDDAGTPTALYITGNGALATLDGLPPLTSIGSSLHVGNNAALVDIDALGSITQVGGTVTISNNDALTDVAGLSRLDHVGATLLISDNEALASLRGLERLHAIGSTLWLTGNPRLASLGALAALVHVGEEVDVRDNPALPAAEVEALLARLGRTP